MCSIKKKCGVLYSQLKRADTRTRKLRLPSHHTSAQVLERLKAEFQLNPAKYSFVLLNTSNEEVTFDTVRDYYKSQRRRYMGCTRLYLGVSPLKDENAFAAMNGAAEDHKYTVDTIANTAAQGNG